MDLQNANRIMSAINSLNSVTVKDAATACLLIDAIEQLEEIIAEVHYEVRIDEWRKRLGASNGC